MREDHFLKLSLSNFFKENLMESTPNGHLKHPVAREAITAVKVTSVRERMACLPNLVGVDCVVLEHTIYGMLRSLSPDYDGGFWDYFQLSNEGFFMAPETAGLYRIRCDCNGFSGTVSAEVAGIITCAMAYSHMSFGQRGERFARAYELLCEFTFQHAEVRIIRAALD